MSWTWKQKYDNHMEFRKHIQPPAAEEISVLFQHSLLFSAPMMNFESQITVDMNTEKIV